MRKTAKTSARGYGAGHQALRKCLEPEVAAGTVRCARCGELIRSGEPWHLDHSDDRRGYLGPSHASCNTSAGARKARPGEGSGTRPEAIEADLGYPFYSENGIGCSRRWTSSHMSREEWEALGVEEQRRRRAAR